MWPFPAWNRRFAQTFLMSSSWFFICTYSYQGSSELILIKDLCSISIVGSFGFRSFSAIHIFLVAEIALFAFVAYLLADRFWLDLAVSCWGCDGLLWVTSPEYKRICHTHLCPWRWILDGCKAMSGTGVSAYLWRCECQTTLVENLLRDSLGSCCWISRCLMTRMFIRFTHVLQLLQINHFLLGFINKQMW